MLLLAVILIAALFGLLALLLHWGQQSIELRESLFIDRANIRINELTSALEDEYYCFDIESELSVPMNDSFHLLSPTGPGSSDYYSIPLRYYQPDTVKQWSSLTIVSPALVRMKMRFEFSDIGQSRPDSSLSPFEMTIRNWYKGYLRDAEGIRLVDTAALDSVLRTGIGELNPEAQFAYSVAKLEGNELVYMVGTNQRSNLSAPDVYTILYENDTKIPDLLLSLKFTNKEELFQGAAWNIYWSAGLLTLSALLLIAYLFRLQWQLKKLLIIQKDFVHGMTHEFNTPLSSIKIIAQKLKRSTDEKTQRSGQVLEDESHKLQTGINLVLTTALIEKGEISLQREKVEFVESMNQILAKNEQSLRNAGIQYSIEHSSEAMVLNVDAFHLQNVIQNLINNVRIHSEASELRVELISKPEGIEMNFIDNGIGIDASKRKDIFKKFGRSGDGDVKSGYGLGLYYCMMIIQLHGGRISLEESEKGSHFRIYLK